MSSAVSQIGTSMAIVTLSLLSMKRCSVSCRNLSVSHTGNDEGGGAGRRVARLTGSDAMNLMGTMRFRKENGAAEAPLVLMIGP